ncbi:MAG TPA: hypothetical protein VMQ44_01740 [Candidatus Saccharimonadales bacterium]|nr:hypothetical protein [Candidatus Saccharimonadales bacterium]
MDGFTLIVVPTCGNGRGLVNGFHPPSEVGMMRLRKAAELLSKDNDSRPAIVGGERRDIVSSEAECARWWFYRYFPEHIQRVAIVRAKAKFTAGDMVDLAANLPAGIGRIMLVTHPDHGSMAEQTLRACGVKIPIVLVDSGEPAPYSRKMLCILDWVYDHDPKWERWHSLPFRWLANRRENPT